ncbi:unnamed protein product [Euphydryas editha]|uniref:Uncharacterized protein n=1 Tax=Euphydryas editha TaxID=104508 RepID=A0AAU9TMW7_EUPED|nr:unnamed protein product [Euphydryas editha]
MVKKLKKEMHQEKNKTTASTDSSIVEDNKRFKRNRIKQEKETSADEEMQLTTSSSSSPSPSPTSYS